MLAFLAIFSAFGAGVLIDSINAKSKSDDIEPNSAEPGNADRADPALPDSDGGNLMDWAAEADQDTGLDAGAVVGGMPVSDDLADSVASPVTLIAKAGDTLLTGGGGDDVILGGDGHDLLAGQGGHDIMAGGHGHDALHAGAGDDRVGGQSGNDTLAGEDGHDSLTGGSGDDSLSGGMGNDILAGGDGHDSLTGGMGDDSLSGGSGNDWVSGGSGQDHLRGGTGQDTLDGGDGDDTIWGQSDLPQPVTPGQTAGNFLNGGAGDDLLHLGAADWGTGDTGADVFNLGADTAVALAHITDYDPLRDTLVVEYDAVSHVSPVLTAEAYGTGQDITLMLDGLPIAVVHGAAGLDLAQVTLRAA